MKKTRGVQYTIDGKANLDDFAKGILALTNVRSGNGGGLIDFSTTLGTNIITVVVKEEHATSHFDNFLKAQVGNIRSKDEIDLVEIDANYIKDELAFDEEAYHYFDNI